MMSFSHVSCPSEETRHYIQLFSVSRWGSHIAAAANNGCLVGSDAKAELNITHQYYFMPGVGCTKAGWILYKQPKQQSQHRSKVGIFWLLTLQSLPKMLPVFATHTNSWHKWAMCDTNPASTTHRQSNPLGCGQFLFAMLTIGTQ